MQEILDQFLRPTKLSYHLADLGPPVFREGHYLVKRTEHQVDSIPFSAYEIKKQNPIILYVHSYNSNRLEVRSVLNSMLKKGFNVVAVQFQRVITENKKYSIDNNHGIITFGFYQFQQLRTVVCWIKRVYDNKNIILWGRSMGSVCCINYQNKYKDASYLILDSPFHNLQQLFATKIKQLTTCPLFLAKSTISILKNKINQYMMLNISEYKIQLQNYEKTLSAPVTFIYNPQDEISNFSSKFLYSNYVGQKQIYFTEKEHNEERDTYIIQAIMNSLTQRFCYSEKEPMSPFFLSKPLEKGIKKLDESTETQDYENDPKNLTASFTFDAQDELRNILLIKSKSSFQ